MALNYSISMRSSNPTDPEAVKKAYAKAQIGSNVSLKTMSKRIASQTTVNRADVMAVLTALVDNIFEVLREGNQVDLGELGKLRLQISSEGAENAESFTSDYIKDVNIQFSPAFWAFNTLRTASRVGTGVNSIPAKMFFRSSPGTNWMFTSLM